MEQAPARVGKQRRLLVLSTRSTSPGQRFRIENWSPYLDEAGIRVVGFPFAPPNLDRLLTRSGARLEKGLRAAAATVSYPFRLPDLDDQDALLIYRAAVPMGIPLLERRLGRTSKPIVLDIDDPIFFTTQGASNPLAGIGGDRKWKRLCGMAAVTTCINQRIADYLAPYSREVAVVPNLIDLARYPERRPEPDRTGVVLGYNGSRPTVPQLAEIGTALERVAKEAQFELRVVGGPSPLGTSAYPVTEPAWTAEGEVDLLHGFDIGLAPAPPEPWWEFKSSVKIIVYMAVGVPVVASPAGSDVIVDGENGFLASTQDEWVEKLLALIRDPELRERMGRKARLTVERDYSLDARVGEVVGLFRRLTG